MELILKKTILTRSAAVLVLGSALAACGGGTSKFTIEGDVYNLQTGTELILATNGMEVTVKQDKPADANGNLPVVHYAFPNQLEYGEVYNVLPKVVSTNADGSVVYHRPAHQNCSPTTSARISDTAGRLSEIRADYACALVTPTIGGVVKGLTVGSVTLLNGSTGGQVTVSAPTTAGDVGFVFSIPVTYGQTYGVTVLSADKVSCTVSNGAGTMGDDNVTNIVVNCTPI